MQVYKWPLIALVSLSAAACSQPESLIQVEGKVLVKKQPAAGVVVSFHRKDADRITASPAVGITDDNGRFTLSTGTKKGARAGEYVVTFIRPTEVKAKIPLDQPDARDDFAGVYANPDTSKYKVDIKPGVNNLEPFDLN